ncbi:MAG: hypothetical protein LBU32_10885 [Clostridiales bacterium]|nr:hypothetical protein [Clostridiales bacterium]
MEKNHAADARCADGNPSSIPLDALYIQQAAEKRSRRLHKADINKGGAKKLNQAQKYMFGYQLFGRVQMPDGRRGFISGRRSSGSFDARTLDVGKISAGINLRSSSI